MPIEQMDKTKVMRPSLIDAVDKINEIITAVNSLDPSGVSERVDALETWKASTDTRIDGIISDVSDNAADIASADADITTIKTTLYTPLSQGGE